MPVKKILSLALALIVSSLGLISLPARAVRAQEVASAGKSIGEIKEEYERLLAIERNPATPSEVKEVNRGFLDERRTQLINLLKTRIDALRNYQASTGDLLKAEESLVIEKNIGALEKEMRALQGDAQSVARTATPAPSSVRAASRPLRAKASYKKAAPDANAASAPAEATPASAPAFAPDPPRDDSAAAAPAAALAPAQARPIEVSPSQDITVPTSEYQIDIKLNEPIDDIMVSVFNDTKKDGPAITRSLEMKPSYQGKQSVVVKLAKGANRIEVDDAKRINNPDVKVTRTLTYTPPTGNTFIAPGAGGGAATDGESKTNAPENVPEYDWGRVRAYFAGGMILSKAENNFSKGDIFLDFTLDKNYLASRKRKVFKDLNTFFNARLTTIPVAQPSPSPGATPTTSSTPCNTPDCTSFITSQKAALMQAGIYLPIYGKWTSWLREVPVDVATASNNKRQPTEITRTYNYEKNALFIAPLIKGGIQTITDDTRTAEGQRFGGDDVFNFFSFGTMLGHFRIPTRRVLCESNDDSDLCVAGSDGRRWKYVRSTNIAPELIRCLTLSVGRWESFEITVPTGFKDKDGHDITVRQRPWRYEALGRLKIPNLPFIVGFDGNFGKGPDDLRFIFGTRFDIGKLFAALNAGQAAKKPTDSAPPPQ